MYCFNAHVQVYLHCVSKKRDVFDEKLK